MEKCSVLQFLSRSRHTALQLPDVEVEPVVWGVHDRGWSVWGRVHSTGRTNTSAPEWVHTVAGFSPGPASSPAGLGLLPEPPFTWQCREGMGLAWLASWWRICLQCGRPRLKPWVGKIPWRRAWQPTPVFLPGESRGQRSLVGYSPWVLNESDTTERLHFHFLPSCIGEGNGNALQCSCLENPRDGGAWWAAVYGVAQSQTRLKRLSSSSSTSYI